MSWKKETKKCLECGIVFTKVQAKKFCSQKCNEKNWIKNNSKRHQENRKKWRRNKGMLDINSIEYKENQSEKAKGNTNRRFEDRSRIDMNKRSNWTAKCIKFRELVFKRDNYRCKICNKNGYIEAHHILSWRDFPEERFNINNGITLCRAHHPRKRAEEKRLIPELQELVSKV